MIGPVFFKGIQRGGYHERTRTEPTKSVGDRRPKKRENIRRSRFPFTNFWLKAELFLPNTSLYRQNKTQYSQHKTNPSICHAWRRTQHYQYYHHHNNKDEGYPLIQ